ncbi:MAG: hypothetical protein JO212_04960 [Acetobacteraceae bacterium]|nr:hypothetical protein [Acetobacteraceae bacterium]
MSLDAQVPPCPDCLGRIFLGGARLLGGGCFVSLRASLRLSLLCLARGALRLFLFGTQLGFGQLLGFSNDLSHAPAVFELAERCLNLVGAERALGRYGQNAITADAGPGL